MEVNLEDKYKLEKGIRFLTGTQALVRLPLVQIRKDNTKAASAFGTCGFRTTGILIT